MIRSLVSGDEVDAVYDFAREASMRYSRQRFPVDGQAADEQT